MNESNVRFLVEKSHNFMGSAFPMWIYRRSPDLARSTTHIATQIVMEELQLGLVRPEAPLSLSTESAVELMDSLWDLGIRPSKASLSMSKNEKDLVSILLNAKDDHIKDLRAIVISRLALEIGS